MRFVARLLTVTLFLGSLSAQGKLRSSEGLETKNQTKVVAHRGTRLRRGGGTRSASFSVNSKGDSTKWVVVSDQGVLR